MLSVLRKTIWSHHEKKETMTDNDGRQRTTIVYKIIENHQNVFFLDVFPPWHETFAEAGDGDGRGKMGEIGINICSTHHPI